jgi:hypothetical protein
LTDKTRESPGGSVCAGCMNSFRSIAVWPAAGNGAAANGGLPAASGHASAADGFGGPHCGGPIARRLERSALAISASSSRPASDPCSCLS